MTRTAGTAGIAPPPARTAVTDGESARKVSWDTLRIGFVLLVVLYHSTFIGPLVYRDILPKNHVFDHQVGASLLLVLSAYFVAATVRRADARPGGTARWWFGKVARLLPPFLVATLNAWIFLRGLAPDGWYYPTVADLGANLAMLWQVQPGRWGFVDGSYWTIPLQLMAFTVAALMWRTPLRGGVALRVVLWLALLVPVAQWHLHSVLPPDSTYVVVTNALGMHRWHLFVAGLAVWMYATGRVRLPHFLALEGVAVAAHALHAGGPDPATGAWGTDLVAVGMIALGVVAMTAAAVGPDWDRWMPGPVQRAVTWSAGISYGIFLTHQTVGYVVMRRLQDLGVGPSLQTVGMIVVGVVAGWLLTRLVERPAHQVLMDAWDRARAASGRYEPVGSSATRS